MCPAVSHARFTLPPGQHNPVDSPLYFNALQYLQMIHMIDLVHTHDDEKR